MCSRFMLWGIMQRSRWLSRRRISVHCAAPFVGSEPAINRGWMDPHLGSADFHRLARRRTAREQGTNDFILFVGSIEAFIELAEVRPGCHSLGWLLRERRCARPNVLDGQILDFTGG